MNRDDTRQKILLFEGPRWIIRGCVVRTLPLGPLPPSLCRTGTAPADPCSQHSRLTPVMCVLSALCVFPETNAAMTSEKDRGTIHPNGRRDRAGGLGLSSWGSASLGGGFARRGWMGCLGRYSASMIRREIRGKSTCTRVSGASVAVRLPSATRRQ